MGFYKYINFDWKLAEVCLLFKKDKNKLNFKSHLSKLIKKVHVGRQIDVLNCLKLHLELCSLKVL